MFDHFVGLALKGLRDRHQILLLILRESKPINQPLFLLKSSENYGFFDDLG